MTDTTASDAQSASDGAPKGGERAAARGSRLVKLCFQPLWRYVDGIREFCGFFARTTFDDPVVGERVGLVVHELVENAIRYSPHTEDAMLELAVYMGAAEVMVTVSNSCDEARVAKLRQVIDEVGSGDPLAVYTEAMRRTRERPEDESGLGLPRIRFEGEMTLSLETEPGVVRVTARGMK